VSNSQTVLVERLEVLPALLMTWAAHPKRNDIDQAFQAIAGHLKNAEHSLFIIIDLTSNVSLPISEIVQISVNGYKHPKFAGALIVGGHQRARRIANIIVAVSKQNKINWFKDETEIYAFIQKQMARNGS
jgi:hypothetical protein